MEAKDITEKQEELLHRILIQNEVIYKALQEAEALCEVPYYIGAGCITQTVWNYLNGLEPMYGISDIDFVYFDSDDLSYEGENERIIQIRKGIHITEVGLDIKNQARIHLWYKDHFGYEVRPYVSVEDAITTWPTTATAIGVRLIEGKLIVYAPFGLEDLFGQVIRANKARITKDIYEKKVSKWTGKWNTLKVIPWEES